MTNVTVDEFISRKVLSEFRPVVEKIRAVMKSCAPEAIEMISYGIPAFKVKNIIAVISPTKKDITLAFSRGAEFEDKYNLLVGVGKVSKHIKFKKISDVDQDILCYYIRQALKFDIE